MMPCGFWKTLSVWCSLVFKSSLDLGKWDLDIHDHGIRGKMLCPMTMLVFLLLEAAFIFVLLGIINTQRVKLKPLQISYYRIPS